MCPARRTIRPAWDATPYRRPGGRREPETPGWRQGDAVLRLAAAIRAAALSFAASHRVLQDMHHAVGAGTRAKRLACTRATNSGRRK